MTFRTGSDGFWLIFLIPLAVFLQDEERHFKALLVIVMINSVLLALFKVMHFRSPLEYPVLQKINIGLSATTLVVCVERGGDPYTFFSLIVINYSFPMMFKAITELMPKSFTFGEGIAVCQAFFVAFWAATTSLIKQTGNLSNFSNTNYTIFYGHLGFLLCLAICRGILFSVRPWRVSPLDLIYCFWVFGAIGAFFSQLSVRELGQLMQWFFALGTTSLRAKLLAFWMILTAAALSFVLLKNVTATKANTRDRKYFHIIMVMVYVPGILMDYSLLYIASIAAMCAFLMLEVSRLLKFTVCKIPVGQFIDDGVQLFRDTQDEGNSLLTPIYLLAGCSLPLWLNMVNPRHSSTIIAGPQIASSLAGILSIGIGDTFASIGGSKYGKFKWPGSLKTVEGTIFSIVTQLLFVLVLWLTDLSPFTQSTVLILLTASVINALVEAKTDQIDNFALPLVTYNVILLLQRTHDFHSVQHMFGV